MNAYRVALILCRAVAIALWWMAGVRLFAALVVIVAEQFGAFGKGLGLPAPLPVPALIGVLPILIVASFLHIFAGSLAASMTGIANFSGDSIVARRALEAPGKALANAGAGLFLLFFGLTTAIPATVSGVYMMTYGGFATRNIASFTNFSLVSNALPAIAQCLVGFVLAFRLGLRRLMKSAQ